MRRGAAGARARAAALALCVVGGLAPTQAVRAQVPVPDAGSGVIGVAPGDLPDAIPVAPGTASPRSSVPSGPVDTRPAAERAEADPLATLEAELAAAGGAYDGFIVVVADVGFLDHLRSLLTTGRPADPIRRGAERVEAVGGAVEGELDGLVTAVVADLTVAEARRLAVDPAVRWISPNATVSSGSRRIATTATHAYSELFLWNLAATDGASSDWGTTALFDRSYVHSSDGSGVDVFVVDTGIDAANADIADRVVPESEYADGYYRVPGDSVEPDDDCDGHGTHVAGTVAGAASGIARGARVVPVKVFAECGEAGADYFDLIQALTWIGNQVGATPTRPYVVNMSLGGPPNAAFEAAVAALIENEGTPRVTVVVAAGNDDVDVNLVSPARVPDAITVGALGNYRYLNPERTRIGFFADERASYSNFGAGVDVMAPGTTTWSACAATNLLGAEYNEAGEFVRNIPLDCTAVTIDGTSYQLTSLQGTSMAAPLVAGLAARYLGDRFDADGTVATPAEVRAALVGGAAADVLSEVRISLGGSPNLVANSRFLEPAPSAPGVPVVTACTGGAAASDLLQLPAEGVGPYTWSVTAGSVPDGLTLSADGRLTGSTTPSTQTGTVTLQVEDPFGRTASATFSRSAFPAGCGD